MSTNAPQGIPPARRIALAVLGRVLPAPGNSPSPGGGGQDAQAALDAAVGAAGIDPRDRGLATELVYGWLRLRRRLEYIVSRLLKNPDAVPVAVGRVLEVFGSAQGIAEHESVTEEMMTEIGEAWFAAIA